MLARIRRNLTFANVCSFVALTVALGTGGAYAANTVFSSDIVDGEVKNADLASGAVTSATIRNADIRGADLAANVVDSSKVLDESIRGADIGSSAVTGSEVATNSLTTSDIAGAAASPNVTIPAGFVANGRCRQLSVSVPGANVGEPALIATNGALQNGVFMYAMRVSTAGTVVISLCNFSGTTMAAISDLPVRVVTFG